MFVHVSCCIAAAISLVLGLYQVIYTLASREKKEDFHLIETILEL